ncbi:hypothetical protein MXM51_01510 [Pantoea stewartii]|uniref:hypothetical protein n=1 Tax=Pantoea stewartii TaxID=66269 RepID=UPI002DBFF26A|nr:hypothetical protein [Pantoea stewartii]MEB6533227.1 hypothetical protein [Pantoea stewartii]
MSDLAMKVLEWQSKGHVGVSSATMASIALGMKKNFYHSHFSAPSDPADLMRCMKLVDEIPEIRNHFTTIGKRVSAFKPILDNWDELVASLKSEISRPDRRAPKTYVRMKELLRE